MNLEKTTDRGNKMNKPKTYGFDEILESMHADLNEYFEEEQNGPYIAFVKGEIGSGKTAFALNLIEMMENQPGERLKEYIEVN